jgi:hypothetical protein
MCERQIWRESHTDSSSSDALGLIQPGIHVRLLLLKFHPEVTNTTVGGKGVDCQDRM